jgi:hypothetical protein
MVKMRSVGACEQVKVSIHDPGPAHMQMQMQMHIEYRRASFGHFT